MSDVATLTGGVPGVDVSASREGDALERIRLVTRGAAAIPWRRGWYRKLRTILVCVDGVAITLAMLITYVASFGFRPGAQVTGLTHLTHEAVGAILGVSWLIMLAAKETRSAEIMGAGMEEYRRVLGASLYASGLLAIVSYLVQAEVSRLFFGATLPLGTCLLLVGRWSTRTALIRARRKGRAMTPTLVVGDQEELSQALRDLHSASAAGYRPAAVCLAGVDAGSTARTYQELPVVRQEDLAEYVRRHGVGAVVVSGGLTRHALRRLAWQIEDSSIELLFVPRLTDVAGPRLSVRPAEGLGLLHVELPRYSGGKYWLKRSFDVLFALGALILTLPILIAIAAAIKLQDGGPVMFRQARVGLEGQVFTIHKFRTMHVDAEQRLADLRSHSRSDGPLFKMPADPRITRIGKFLRKHSLDELPQFWTVLRGGMSIVGPRPHLSNELAAFPDEGLRRLLIKPGITGLWQVSGRSDLSPEDAIRLDLRYVENWSLSGDIALILKTLKALYRPTGAY